EAYCRAQGLFREDNSPEPVFTDTLELDLGTVVPSIAGPARPQDRVVLTEAKSSWRKTLPSLAGAAIDKDTAEKSAADPSAPAPSLPLPAPHNGRAYAPKHGAVVTAAITSCPTTSTPAVLMAAGLLARNAVQKGLSQKPWVKTSLAPGSRVVTDYLDEAQL